MELAEAGQPLAHLRLDDLLAELQARLDGVRATRDRAQALLEAVVAVGNKLDLETVLRRIVEAATGLVGARYGALGVVGERGSLAEFIPVGLDEAEIARDPSLAGGPRPARGTHRSSPVAAPGGDRRRPAVIRFSGGSSADALFLGVPCGSAVRSTGTFISPRNRMVTSSTRRTRRSVALAAAAGVAIENARLYEESRRRQRWLQASAEVSRRLLSGTDPGEVLDLVTQQVLEMSGADLAVLALPDERAARTEDHACSRPGRGEDPGADAARGCHCPLRCWRPASRCRWTTSAGTSGSRWWPGSRMSLGPAVVFPLGAPGNPWRAHGRPPPGGDAAGASRRGAGRLLRGAGRPSRLSWPMIRRDGRAGHDAARPRAHRP